MAAIPYSKLARRNKGFICFKIYLCMSLGTVITTVVKLYFCMYLQNRATRRNVGRQMRCFGRVTEYNSIDVSANVRLEIICNLMYFNYIQQSKTQLL
jgi:hypothetical protein